MTQFNQRLFVEIVPLETEKAPKPHPIKDGKFDPKLVYKVLGIYNPSETSECYFMMANPEREIWFIPQRHVRAFKLIDSDEFFMDRDGASGGRAAGANATNVRASQSHSATGKSSMAGPISTLPVGSNRLP